MGNSLCDMHRYGSCLCVCYRIYRKGMEMSCNNMKSPQFKSKMKSLQNDKGQSVVEFALVLPLLLILVVGIIEWGIVLWAQSAFDDATRAGARAASVMTDWDVNRQNDTTAVKNVVKNDLGSLPSIVKQNIDSNIVVELLPDQTNIQSIRVSIDKQPYSPVIASGLIPTPASLSASAEYRYESSL
jgi:Flp pilus assembly protein TadG